MLHCEVRRSFQVGNRIEHRWKEEAVKDLIADPPPGDIRCIHCNGAVQLHRKRVPHGPIDHVEHLPGQDMECRGRPDFKGEHRMSTNPLI